MSAASLSDLARVARALPTMLRVGFSAVVAYRVEFFVWILAYTMPLIMLALWTAVAREAPVGRFGEKEFQAYFLATLVIRLLAASWVVWELTIEIRHGTLGMRLLRPVHPLLSFATENLAAIPMRLAAVTPIAGLSLLWIGVGVLSDDPIQLLLFPLTLVGAWLMMFLIMSLIGTVALFSESSLALFDLWLGLYVVFSGYVMPLELYPDWIQSIVNWLPFRFMLSFPVETLLGLSPREATVNGLLFQAMYVVVLFVSLRLLWRAGIRRFAAYGG